jgi:predicted MPP superfamily phosphohydrolase
MRNRSLVLLGIIGLLAFYASLKAAAVFPSHPVAAMAASILLVAFFVAWQFVNRSGALAEESVWTRALAWSASVGMGVWATFLLLSIGADAAHLLLSESPRGAVLARALPAAVGGASVLIAGLGLGQAVKGPRVKKVAVPVSGLAAGLRGLRIVQLSDLHVGPTIRRQDVERVVERALALEPDLIAITGDLVDGTVERLARHVAPLGRLRAPLGVFYVTGNHEYYWGAGDWLEKVKELGFVPLINENRVVSRGGARLLVGGIPDESGGSFAAGHDPDALQAAEADGAVDFRLLLAHRPDGVPAAARAGFDLQLSGHTHGGQFFPASLLVGFFHRYTRGLARHGRMWVHVSPGTGYWGPAHRFGVPAEITLLTLKLEEQEKVS